MFSPEPFLFEEALFSLSKNKNPLIHKSLRIYNGLKAIETEKFTASFEEKISLFDKRKQFCNKLAYCLKMLEINPFNQLAAATASLVLEKFGLFLLSESIAFNAYSPGNTNSFLLECLLNMHIRNMNIADLDSLIAKNFQVFLQSKRGIKLTINMYKSTQYVRGLEILKAMLLENNKNIDLKKVINEIDSTIKEISCFHGQFESLSDTSFKEQLDEYAKDKLAGTALATAFFWFKHHQSPFNLDILYLGSGLIEGELPTSHRYGYVVLNYLRLCPNNYNYIIDELPFNVFKRFHYIERGYSLVNKYVLSACNETHLSVERKLKFYYDYLIFDSYLGVTRCEPLLSFEKATALGLLMPYNLDILQLGSAAILADNLKHQKKYVALVHQLSEKNQAEILGIWQQIHEVSSNYNLGFFEKICNWILALISKKAKLKQKKMIAIQFSGQMRKPEISHQALNTLFAQLGSLKSVRLASVWDKQGISIRSDSLPRFMPTKVVNSLPESLRKAKFLAKHLPLFFQQFTVKQDAVLSRQKIIKLFKLDKLNFEDEASFDESLANYPELFVRGTTNQAKMYFQIARVFDLARSKAREHFYAVIRIRPDIDLSLNILRDMCIVAEQKKDTIFLTYVFPTTGVGDQFAVGSPLAMELYCSLWGNAKQAGKFQYLSCFPEGTKTAGEILLQYHLMAFGLSMCLIPSSYKLINPNPLGSVDNRKELFSDFENLDLKFKNQFWGFYQQYTKHVQDFRKSS